MRTILVADDQPLMGVLLENTLGSDFRVLKVRDGFAAVDLAVREHPDLIVVDLAMPGLDGIGVCELLKADPALRRVPVLMLTGSQLPRDKERASAAGIDAFVTKPFSPLALREQVTQLLGRASLA